MAYSFKMVHDGISTMILITLSGTIITIALFVADLYASLRAFGLNPMKGFKKDEEP